MGMVRRAFPPQSQGLPIDGREYALSHERIGPQGAMKLIRRPGAPLQMQCGRTDALTLAMAGDFDVDVSSRRSQPPTILRVHGHERRHMKRFGQAEFLYCLLDG